ncbi:hypothetical protein ACOXN6_004905 [Shigella sonnei]
MAGVVIAGYFSSLSLSLSLSLDDWGTLVGIVLAVGTHRTAR